MKKLLSLLFFQSFSLLVSAQEIYIKTFGESINPPLLYLHGGPGGSSIDFEVTTAERLAAKGFFVIVYDRRGEGRSDDDKAEFTFAQTFADLNSIYKQFGIKEASILGHSFGGIVAIKYAAEFPGKVKSIVLAGAPVDLQMSFRTILETVKNKAEAKSDSATLKQVTFVQKQDTNSIYYSSGSFMLAMQNGIYTVSNQDSLAKQLHQDFREHELVKVYLENQKNNNYKNMYAPTMGFLNNEKYTQINLVKELKHIERSVPVYGIYGTEDGLFDAQQINLIKSLATDFLYLENCSHSVFLDKQSELINALVAWLK